MIDELAETMHDPLTFRAAFIRVWTAACILGFLGGLMFFGWNMGPAPHLGLQPIDAQTALGYAALACVVRYTLGHASRRPSSPRVTT
jgi:hypothetical protein